jgi:hypothetical protein
MTNPDPMSNSKKEASYLAKQAWELFKKQQELKKELANCAEDLQDIEESILCCLRINHGHETSFVINESTNKLVLVEIANCKFNYLTINAEYWGN